MSERETKTITTPISADTIVIKTYLTGREKRALTNVFLQEGLDFNAETKNVKGLNAKLIDQNQDLGWKTVIVSINGKQDGAQEDGKTFSLVEAVLDMRSEDFDFITDQVNEIIKDRSFEEKKTI